MTNPVPLAIVIVSWESAGYLSHAVASAVQSIDPGDQIIVWDNASGPDTQRELDNIAAQWPATIIERCSENLGFAAGNNRAIELAQADANILCLNPDAQLTQGALAEMRAVLTANRQTAAVGAIQLTSNETQIDGLGDRLTYSGRPQRIAIGKPASQVSQQISTKRFDDIFSPCAAVALYRRSALIEVGGFDEDFFCYCEDIDLGFRLRLAGFNCVRANKAVALHIGSASSGRHSEFTSFHGHRNLVWTFIKDMPGPLFAALMIPHAVLNLGSVLLFTLRGRPGVLIRAKYAALAQLPMVWRKRREIQRQRRASFIDIFRALG